MLLRTVVILAIVATVVVLFLGVRSMAQGGPEASHHGARLMSVRVGLQMVAFILVILALLLAA